MKKLIALTCMATAVAFTSGVAMADDITGKLGLTGRIGFLVPADSEHADGKDIETEVGYVGGGGFIYGFSKNFAGELDITHTEFNSDHDGANFGDFETTNVALGVQYRFDDPVPKLTPYVGGGLDILINDFTTNEGASRDVDTTAGIHLSGGIDYFIVPQFALTTEMKLLFAPEADITNPANGAKIGDYDPSSFAMTFAFRFFFN
ncbi:MAG: outer membrane beta-barrel protein [Geobacter sp.]|nr:outer membrane beta-barrel protein [Geobacter sp.]